MNIGWHHVPDTLAHAEVSALLRATPMRQLRVRPVGFEGLALGLTSKRITVRQ